MDYIGKNVKGTMLFVDTDSAEINAEHARVWVKMEYPDGASDIFLVAMLAGKDYKNTSPMLFMIKMA